MRSECLFVRDGEILRFFRPTFVKKQQRTTTVKVGFYLIAPEFTSSQRQQHLANGKFAPIVVGRKSKTNRCFDCSRSPTPRAAQNAPGEHERKESNVQTSPAYHFASDYLQSNCSRQEIYSGLRAPGFRGSWGWLPEPNPPGPPV